MIEETVHVACLCAAWCRLCDEYSAVLESVTQELKALGSGLRLHWIDIEDEAELVGDVDVETFPTLVIVGPEGVRFAGPVAPQPEVLRRLLRLTVLDAGDESKWAPVAAEIASFAERLRCRAGPEIADAAQIGPLR